MENQPIIIEDHALQVWLDNKNYLHHYFRQEKDVPGIFSVIYEVFKNEQKNEPSYGPNGHLHPDVAQNLVMNFVFPFFAKYGYVLAPAQSKLDFNDKTDANQKKIMRWREDQKFLPYFLKDFHDQKLFMKALAHYDGCDFFDNNPTISWQDVHCYLIDFFLWRLARFGLVMKKSRKHLDFLDIDTMLNEFDEMMAQSFHNLLKNELDKNQK